MLTAFSPAFRSPAARLPYWIGPNAVTTPSESSVQ
jgi:hypothetical protein